jgi:hypothetical protein
VGAMLQKQAPHGVFRGTSAAIPHLSKSWRSLVLAGRPQHSGMSQNTVVGKES